MTAMTKRQYDLDIINTIIYRQRLIDQDIQQLHICERQLDACETDASFSFLSIIEAAGLLIAVPYGFSILTFNVRLSIPVYFVVLLIALNCWMAGIVMTAFCIKNTVRFLLGYVFTARIEECEKAYDRQYALVQEDRDTFSRLCNDAKIPEEDRTMYTLCLLRDDIQKACEQYDD